MSLSGDTGFAAEQEAVVRRHYDAGKIRAGTRIAALIEEGRILVHLSFGGRTMEFDTGGICVSGR